MTLCFIVWLFDLELVVISYKQIHLIYLLVKCYPKIPQWCFLYMTAWKNLGYIYTLPCIWLCNVILQNLRTESWNILGCISKTFTKICLNLPRNAAPPLISSAILAKPPSLWNNRLQQNLPFLFDLKVMNLLAMPN